MGKNILDLLGYSPDMKIFNYICIILQGINMSFLVIDLMESIYPLRRLFHLFMYLTKYQIN